MSLVTRSRPQPFTAINQSTGGQAPTHLNYVTRGQVIFI
jgi:hypothetical protein